MGNKIISRRVIGLLFLSDYATWSGGTIYILNIISALNILEDEIKPNVLVFHGMTSPINDILAIKYPYLKLVPINVNLTLIERIRNTLTRILTNKSVYFKSLPEIVYPYQRGICLGKSPFFWIPDFQEWYLPHMFSDSELKFRKDEQLLISQSKGIVVFSSNNALNDFQKFFPDHNCDLRLLRFATSLPEYKHLNIFQLKKKYDISETYFMSPNQFWKHKNHIVILKAISALKEFDLDFQVVFTGSENDHRNKDHFQTLKDFVEQNGIQKWTRFLGFISRAEQLNLMDNSIAIIQPSLFEGWSTVVEDTKALSQYIILSDIEVHQEQIDQNCTFFLPHSSTELASIMKSILTNGVSRKRIDYSNNVLDFGKSIVEVLKH